MTALNTFVANRIPLELRHGRDFTGARGWCHLGNQIIRMIEAEGLLERDRVYECPVVPDTVSNRFITVPADFKRALMIYTADDEDDKRAAQWVDGKLRLVDEYADAASILDAATAVTTIPAAATTTDCWILENVSHVFVNDDLNGYAIKFHTLNEWRLILDSVAGTTSGPFTSHVYWTRPTTSAPTNASLVSVWSGALMLRYERKYDTLSINTSDIPLNAAFEDVLTFGMCWLASKVGSREAREYERMFRENVKMVELEEGTPSMEDMRPQGRAWPSFDDTDDKCQEYIGE